MHHLDRIRELLSEQLADAERVAASLRDGTTRTHASRDGAIVDTTGESLTKALRRISDLEEMLRRL